MTDKNLKNKMASVYGPAVKDFFNDLESHNFTDEELNAVPALFLPGWGEAYSTSVLKIAIAGKETLSWAHALGDSLLTDFNAVKNNTYTPELSCKRFRADGPAEWLNPFWQYAAAAIGKVFDQNKFSILEKDSPILRSIAWFNGHAVETEKSAEVKSQIDEGKITSERLQTIQDLADKHGLSRFDTFIKVFQPHVILYFYRDSEGQSLRNLSEEYGCEFRQSWGDGEAIREYQMGDTIILNMRHTTWMRHGNMKEKVCAELVANILQIRRVLERLGAIGQFYSVDTMSAQVWRDWVSIVRNEADEYECVNDLDLSHHLMLTVARELCKTKSTMTAQTLVLLLNEVTKFRNDQWLYSPNGRGPCKSVASAFHAYHDQGNLEDAKNIAEAFRKLNGEVAYE
ncbi:MAG: hypothetical protein J5858_07175 [Lentisphaeria bacterium]|nr:hypothetical protein [Lentisphaeria bacterium]